MARPPFNIALQEWRLRLEAAGASTNIYWAFHENLCIRRSFGFEPRFHLLYQFEWPCITESDAGNIYMRIARVSETVAFQRLFSVDGFSLCTLAADDWDSEEKDFHSDWQLYFTIGQQYELHSEVKNRWEWWFRRLLAVGVLSGIDFIVSYRRAMNLPFGAGDGGKMSCG